AWRMVGWGNRVWIGHHDFSPAGIAFVRDCACPQLDATLARSLESSWSVGLVRNGNDRASRSLPGLRTWWASLEADDAWRRISSWPDDGRSLARVPLDWPDASSRDGMDV
ncbi:MAG: hypothetical protein ACKVHP_06590, partial [Verrucomicrobiales bacterium]